MSVGAAVVVVAVLLAMLVFAALVLAFASKAGGVKEVRIGAKVGKYVDIGAQVRFDIDADTGSAPIEVTSQQAAVTTLDATQHGGDAVGGGVDQLAHAPRTSKGTLTAGSVGSAAVPYPQDRVRKGQSGRLDST
jgi:hypothetical protein